jgi:hypothetical protein
MKKTVQPWAMAMLAWMLWGQYAYNGVPIGEPFPLASEAFQTFEECQIAFQFAGRIAQEIREERPQSLVDVQYACLPVDVPPTFTWPKGS